MRSTVLWKKMSSSLLRSSRDFNLMLICYLQAWDYCADLGKWWDWAAVSGKKSRWSQVKSQIKTLQQVELSALYVSSHTVKRTETYQRKKSKTALGRWFWELVKWACCAVRHYHEVFSPHASVQPPKGYDPVWDGATALASSLPYCMTQWLLCRTGLGKRVEPFLKCRPRLQLCLGEDKLQK